MMSMIWLVLSLALTGSQCVYGLPVRPTPQDYPHDGNTVFENWTAEGGLYAAIPALALVATALVLAFGCTWCYRHKDRKQPNEGTDNQLFTASAQQLHAAARAQPPDSGFSEPANNNVSEDNNNGPISLREMQNIANNNAAAYIVSENEERNRVSRESVIEFEPLPTAIVGADPLERCADWFGEEDFPRNNLQYLREIGRGWFGRVVEGEIEEAGASTNVAVKILNQNASLEDKARFLDEAKLYRDVTHENILAFIGKYLQEDPWILMFELCSMDLQQYLTVNRPKMAALNDSGVPLQLMCDVSAALAYLHARGYTYGRLWGGAVLVRGQAGEARAVLGRYGDAEPPHDCRAPDLAPGAPYTPSSDIWSLGSLIWEVCSWGSVPTGRPSPPPELPCPYKNHLYQVMQLCWQAAADARPSAAQVHALLAHLHGTRPQAREHALFEERWQRLKPNSIPKLDEHVAIVHAHDYDAREHATLHEYDAREHATSRSSSAMSDKPSELACKSDSLTNLHGSLDDVRNIYLTHNEAAALDCHQGNVLEDKEQDRSDASVDPWLKDIIAGSHDDVSYYKDVSDVIKNLDNILNSEKTSSSESSHQASPSRDNLSLDCKKEYPMQSSLVKSPGITNFQNILDTGFGGKPDGETCMEDDLDRDTIGTLSHSFERHSDTTSQHTLENLTPDTPMKDLEMFMEVERQATDAEISEIESQIKSVEVPKVDKEAEKIVDVNEIQIQVERDVESPKEVNERNVPELKELCAASMPSVSDNERSPREDCQTPCDIVTEIRTEEETKSIDDVRDTADSTPLEVIEVTDSVEDQPTDVQEVILPVSTDETTISNEVFDTLPSVTEDVSTATQENDTSLVKLEDIGPESMESEYNYSKDETILVSDLVDTVTDSSKDELKNQEVMKLDVTVDIESITPKQMPVSVQTIDDKQSQETAVKHAQKADPKLIEHIDITPTHLPPEIVQNTEDNKDAPVPVTENLVIKEVVEDIECVDYKDSEVNNTPRSDSLVLSTEERADDSAEPKDLINNTNSQILKDSIVDNSVNEVEIIGHSETAAPGDDSALSKNESTQYLDLPSFDMLKASRDFLQREIMNNSQDGEWKVVASTPKGSDTSGDMLDSIDTVRFDDTVVMATKVPLYEPETSTDQKCNTDILSPFESPSHKSHQTDTYDENSSVVLGPFENCNMDIFKSSKPNIDPVELPREELLAFSSNFSEINLETPSPLRDGNFLNEVPDITPDIEHFDDIASISEVKDIAEAPSEATASCSGTQKRVSPSTPPNSPGISLTSTLQAKYLVDIDLGAENAPEPETSRPIDINQIELQITSKLAMAENENNLNIEYSGPLTVEGLIEEGGSVRESDAVPEYYLAGNGGSVEDVRELLSLDEECVKALRNELELKLPLAQVAAIEPAGEPAEEGGAGWGAELPPPPELVVSYPGALSPIQEETGQQLSAYENDTHWNPSTRTDSSESYPEPCNNSTDSATSLPRGDTYTVASRDARAPRLAGGLVSSREITMSADSLNGSPHKTRPDPEEALSPINDKTFTKEEAESNCERLSQVSPFLVSPTTDTDTGDAGRGSTLPSDDRSKPDHGLSKATSIDSWCSNDTLYNLEENFDELALDELAAPGLTRSDSEDTLTHEEPSHCSTYLVHEGSFSPDSIAADRTYTKPAELPHYSSCGAEAAADDAWRLPQPELLRRSPAPPADLSPPRTPQPDDAEQHHAAQQPQATERRLSKADSVEITCLQDAAPASPHLEGHDHVVSEESPDGKNLAPVATSTPFLDLPADLGDAVGIPLNFPEQESRRSEGSSGSTDFEAFRDAIGDGNHNLDSEEMFRSLRQESDDLLVGESATLSQNSKEFSIEYLDARPQENSRESNSRSAESGLSAEEFRMFSDSLRARPQDLGSLVLASSSLLCSERSFADLTPSPAPRAPPAQPAHADASSQPVQPLDISPPSITNLIESHELVDTREPPSSSLLINFNIEDETEQPHSIIVIEDPQNSTRISPVRSRDSYVEANLMDFSHSYHPQDSRGHVFEDRSQQHLDLHTTNGDAYEQQPESLLIFDESTSNHNIALLASSDNVLLQLTDTSSDKSLSQTSKDLQNGSAESSKIEGTDASKVNGSSEKFATVNFLNETFEELVESSVDDSDSKDDKLIIDESALGDNTSVEKVASPIEQRSPEHLNASRSTSSAEEQLKPNGESPKMTAVTEDFLQNEKKYATIDSYFPLLSDIRFTGPATEMSTSFQDSPTSAASPECERDKPDAADILKEWDSDSDTHSTNSSSGEFIWKDGAGLETSVVSSTHFDHQRDGGGPAGGDAAPGSGGGSGASDGSSDGSDGSEGSEVEFVPSSWDCRAAPSKSSLRSLEQATPESKKRVVFKRQKYHCVYEYPREAADGAPHSPAYLPDLSTYCEWEPTSAEEAELCYGQLFSSPAPYPLRAGGFGPDYDEDFFISSSARPFESLGIMSTTSQFFPGGLGPAGALGGKRALLDEAQSPPGTPLAAAAADCTPDSGVEDVPSVLDEEFPREPAPRPDSASSGDSASPGSPAELGGLRHTRDRLKLDLPPSPHAASPRHARVFNFTLAAPRRAPPDAPADAPPAASAPEPTFSTFGKLTPRLEPDHKLVLTDEPDPRDKPAADSADEDSGIESSSKATLERRA